MKSRVRASVVVVHDGKILVFNGVDPQSGRQYWFLPGGKIEARETPWACAAREALEETGYRIRALPETEIVKFYEHPWNGDVYSCKTYFYKGELAEEWHSPRPVEDVDYNRGAAWLEANLALESFSYTPEICEAVSELLSIR